VSPELSGYFFNLVTMKFLTLFSLSLFLSISTNAQMSVGKIEVDKEDFEEFEVFADSLDPYRVYFTGENHNYLTFNSKFEWKMLRYLHQHQNVRYFIFEQSPAVGYLVEKFIIEGDKESQNYLKSNFYRQFYNCFKSIKEYNDSLSVEDKIHFAGIDVERFPYFSVEALHRITKDLPTDGMGGEVFEQITALQSSDFKYGTADEFYANPQERNFLFGEMSGNGAMESIIKISNKYADSLKVVLGKDSSIYYAIIKSLQDGKEWYQTEKKGDPRSPIVRERFMQNEFERIYKTAGDVKFYGQFGRCHLQKDPSSRGCYDYYMNSIANRIQEIDDSLNHKVLVIPIYYSTGVIKFDREAISSLKLEEKYMEEGTSYIIDLAYQKGSQFIDGFYNKLPFVIVSNEKNEPFEEMQFSWDETITEYHLGGYYGYRYFNGMNRLNNVLANQGSNTFTNKFVAYDFSVDLIEIDFMTSRMRFTYIPEMSNGDRFDIKGWQFGLGYGYAYGNKWCLAQFGMDFNYGQMKLTEQLDNTVPNLIQSEGNNLIIYTNDVFTLDPNLELRLTLPVISLNFRAGYAFDVSGKYWRLDKKMKDFVKTSWSTPYIQAGVSLNFKLFE